VSFAIYPSLAGRMALITGGGSGIGASLVEHFLEQDSRVSFLDIDEDASEQLLETLSEKYGRAPLFVGCDVTDHDQLRQSMEEVRHALGPISVLVNNAGNDDRHNFQDQRMAVLVKHQFLRRRRCMTT
jgi:NAD(P)-dependent dehydrogenase (short-subunit alcohol dehydrogenase family)